VPMDRPEELVGRIEASAPELKVRVVEEGKALYTDPQDPYLTCLRRAAQEVNHRDPGLIRKHASSDARHFSALGIPAAVFGPSGGNVHGNNEWVDLRQVTQFHKVLAKFVDEAQKVRSEKDHAAA
jgi:succinyl-diaminopimelate desuccinylase